MSLSAAVLVAFLLMSPQPPAPESQVVAEDTLACSVQVRTNSIVDPPWVSRAEIGPGQAVGVKLVDAPPADAFTSVEIVLQQPGGEPRLAVGTREWARVLLIPGSQTLALDPGTWSVVAEFIAADDTRHPCAGTAEVMVLGPDDCDLKVAIGGGAPGDDGQVIAGGEGYDVYLYDFPAEARITLTQDADFMPPSPNMIHSLRTDSDGNAVSPNPGNDAARPSYTLTIKAWPFTRDHHDFPEGTCVDTVIVTVAAIAAATPQPVTTPAPTAPPPTVPSVGTPLATASAPATAGLPNTAIDVDGRDRSASRAMAIALLAAAAGMAVAARRRHDLV